LEVEKLFGDIQSEIQVLRKDLRELKEDLQRPKPTPMSAEEAKRVVETATEPLLRHTKTALAFLEEVRDLQIANGGPQNSSASMGLGTEITITEAVTQIEGIINPLKENVAEVAKESKALNTTCETYLPLTTSSDAPRNTTTDLRISGKGATAQKTELHNYN
jgi:uncharacterized protein (UPF0147 family)